MTHGTLALTRREQRQFGLFAVPEDAELDDELSPVRQWCTECELWVKPVTIRDLYGQHQQCPNCGAEL